MAHKKGQGTSKNGRDSNSKRLGVKKFGGETVLAGKLFFVKEEPNITPEQCRFGSRFHSFALTPGKVEFDKKHRLVNVISE